MKSPAEWVEILTSAGVRAETTLKWADAFSVEVTPAAFSKGVDEIDDFLANILHESGRLETLEENLNYSAEALIAKFGRHRISEADAWKYGRTATQKANQPMIANLLYGGPWGAKNLGNTETGDGWKYRGSGPIQVTGKANMLFLEDKLGIPLVNEPDRLRRPGTEGLLVAIAWWEGKVPDAVIGSIRRTRKAVNGGDLGLADVADLTEKLGAGLA